MKKLTLFACALLLLSVVFVSCSDKKEAAPENKGVIEEMTDEIAKEAVEKIRTPIDKARSVEGIQNKRVGNVEKELRETH